MTVIEVSFSLHSPLRFFANTFYTAVPKMSYDFILFSSECHCLAQQNVSGSS